MSESITIKERPILFSGNMIRAILNGHKTQTRRIVKTPTQYGIESCDWTGTGFGQRDSNGTCSCEPVKCPYGFVGDRLWVRETFAGVENVNNQKPWPGIPHKKIDERTAYIYRASSAWCDDDGWKPSIHMPREASRITLEIKNIRVERLQEISELDAEAEGIQFMRGGEDLPAAELFEILWNSIYGWDSWEQNPWVWVIEFEKK
ncbi:hypothetical protein FH587_04500 (plasmid) [Leptospira interrogans]|uniref:hypothetical protein n=1 Tax=Leptospira interrogans TaxID=173 RepID=UPI001F087E33|nr:hypothetical protein [Leptospira interrogans]UML83076.1 hypothetical protein FH587_04340 [Leptospira interrogans]UML83106.1 hypothetical protein FH587_04500 [Leptospira interrogans]